MTAVNAIRQVIIKYYNLLYQSDIFGEKNKNLVFSLDESLLVTNEDNKQIWIKDAINNLTKDFKVDIAFERSGEIL